MDAIGCPVCHEAFSDKQPCVVTRCGHTFDENCIKGWLLRNSTCPSCRHPCTIYDLSKVHFCMVPVAIKATADGVDDLRTRLEDLGIKEAIAKSKVEDQRKELEMVLIEKNTLYEDLQAALIKVEELQGTMDKENLKMAEKLSRLERDNNETDILRILFSSTQN